MTDRLDPLARVAHRQRGERGALLEMDDSLLPRVRDRALTSNDAHLWLLDSARGWARRYFAQRDLPPRPNLEDAVRALYWKQVAVLVRDVVLIPYAGREGTQERILVGLLEDDSHDYYIRLRTSRVDRWNGMTTVQDIVELPTEYQTDYWPQEA